MGFKFNPVLQFVCKLCRQTYPTANKLIQHKIMHHLGDCLNIKAIVFEEKFIEHDSIINVDLGLPIQASTENSNATLPAQPLKKKGRQSPKKVGSKSKQRPKLKLGRSKKPTPTVFNKKIRLPAEITISKLIPGLKIEAVPELGPATSWPSSLLQAPTNSESLSQNPAASGSASITANGHDVKDEIKLFSGTYPPASITDYYFDAVEYPEPTKLNLATNVLNENFPGKVEFIDSDLLPSSFLHQNWTFPESIEEKVGLPMQGIHQNQGQGNFEVKQLPQTTRSTSILDPFTCEVCFASFRSGKLLDQHRRAHFSHRCGYCAHKSRTLWELRRHLVVHGRITPFQCDLCRRSFTDKKKLEDHQRTHTGDQPFKCPVTNCATAFTSKNALTMHTRCKHSQELGLQQFGCPTCGKTFGLRSHLSRHLPVHGNDRPFKCTRAGCSMEFKHKGSLMNHLSKLCKYTD